MSFLSEQVISCPYCGESIMILVDPQEVNHEYIEDCQVCCRPILFCVDCNEENEITIRARSENE